MRDLVAIGGPGRSGTSLTARIVSEFGVYLGDNLISPSIANPTGFFEDAQVVSIHKELLHELQQPGLVGACIPLPDNWESSAAAVSAEEKIVLRLGSMFERADVVAVKDPRISVLFPLWQRVCIRMGVRLRPIIGIRHPSAVAQSIRRVSSIGPSLADAIWLNRTCAAISATAGAHLIVDYASLLKNRVESLEQIAIFLKSDLFIPTTSPSVLAAIVDPTFDHFGSQNVDLSILSHEVYSMVQSARMAPELEPQLVELCSKVLANLAADGPWCETIRMCLALEGFEDHLKKNVASGTGKSNFSTASDGEPKSVKGVLSVIEEMSDSSAHVRRSARERDLSYYCHARLEEPAAALEKLVVSEHRKTTSRRLVKIDRATGPEKKRPPISLRTRLRARLFSPYFMLRSFGSRILRYVKDRQSEGGIRTAFKISGMPDRPLLTNDPGDLVKASDFSPLPCEIMFIGPGSFRLGIWSTRAQYIFPDLVGSLGRRGKIVFVTARIPDWALPEAVELSRKYGVVFHQIAASAYVRPDERTVDFWTRVAITAAFKYRPRLITNVFGGVEMGYAGSYAAKLIGARSIIRVAGDEVKTRASMGRYTFKPDDRDRDLMIEGRAVHRSHKVVVMAEHEKQRLLLHGGNGLQDKIEVCIRGVDLVRFPKSSRNRDRVKVLFVGRQSREKGYDLFQKLAQESLRLGLPFTFHVAGNFDKGIKSGVEYLGFVSSDDLPNLYETHDLYVNTSEVEGMPQALCEALASGMPSVVPEEIFGTSMSPEQGVLTCKREVDAYLGCITCALQSNDFFDLLSMNARRFAETKLSSSYWSTRYRSIVDDQLGAAMDGENSRIVA